MEAAPDTAPSEAEVAAYAAPLLAALPCVCVKCSSIATPVTPAAASSVTAECAARFLRICSGDCAKAAHVLTAHVQWRQSFGVDALMAEPEETSYARARAIQPIFPMGMHSRRSRGGHAIYILRVGHAMPSAGRAANVFGTESGVDAWLKYHVWCNERCLQAHPQKLVIWDLDNLSRAQLANTDSLRLLRRLISIDIQNYPLSITKVLVVNSPYILQTVWPAVAAMMDEATLSKVRLLGRVEEPEVAAALREEVHEVDLPAYLGGGFDGPTPLGLALPEAAPGAERSAGDGTWREYFFG